MDDLTRWVHLLGLATYLGSTLGLVLMVLPAAQAIVDPALQRRVLAKALRPYNVLSVGALGVLLMTGASSLTDLKATMHADFGRLLWPLVWKLGLSFLLINVATYLSFGLAHRLVRAELGQLPVEPVQQAGILRRMRGTAWVAVGLAAYTPWVGLRLLREPERAAFCADAAATRVVQSRPVPGRITRRAHTDGEKDAAAPCSLASSGRRHDPVRPGGPRRGHRRRLHARRRHQRRGRDATARGRG